ncbi:mitochondrial import inner membrane translocase subunit Tim10 B, partial [Silurus asotus]
LRDFLLVYNRMTEICFQRCTNNFNYRTLTMDEERCVDNCAGKLIRSNHRLMGTYVKLMPAMVQRRMEELESKAAEAAKATEAIGPVEPPTGGLNLSVAPSTEITSTLAKPAPDGLTPASAAEVSGTASITILSAPSPSKNEAFVSPIPVTESAHKCSTEHPSKHASLDLTSPLLEGLHVSTPPAKPSVETQESFSSASSGIALKNVDVNHIGIVNSSISPPASAHQSTGGERPPS